VSVPSRTVKKKGLSEGTISRLRKVTYSASKSVDSLTQCAVCLEVYEEGDYLMVRDFGLKSREREREMR